jgi:hypothetical protein
MQLGKTAVKAGGRGLPAGAHQQHDPLGVQTAAGEGQGVQRAAVQPVGVVGDHQDRGPSGQIRQQGQDGHPGQQRVRSTGVRRKAERPQQGLGLPAATGARVPGLRFGDLRAHALLAALCAVKLLPHGFANRDLRPLIAQFLGKPPEAITSGQMSYDLRRLRVHGLIERIPHTHRYHVTATGLTEAMFLTRLHDRLLRNGLAELTSSGPAPPASLRAADRAYHAAINDLTRRAGIAA